MERAGSKNSLILVSFGAAKALEEAKGTDGLPGGTEAQPGREGNGPTER